MCVVSFLVCHLWRAIARRASAEVPTACGVPVEGMPSEVRRRAKAFERHARGLQLHTGAVFIAQCAAGECRVDARAGGKIRHVEFLPAVPCGLQ